MGELKRLNNKNKSRIIYHGAEVDCDKTISPALKYEGLLTFFYESNDSFNEIHLNKETVIALFENIKELINNIK